MQSKPKKKSVRTLVSGKFESHMYVPDKPKKKKSTPKKLYICVDTGNHTGGPSDTVEKAWQKLDNEWGEGAIDCTFYEVKEVKVVSGIHLA